MATGKNKRSRIRLVYRRSSPLLKCVVMAAIVLSTVTILTLRSSILELRGNTEELRQEAAGLEQENQDLQKNIAELGTVQSIKRIAREKLGLVDPDSIFFDPVQK